MTYMDIPMRAVGPRMKKAYTTQTAIRTRMVAWQGTKQGSFKQGITITG